MKKRSFSLLLVLALLATLLLPGAAAAQAVDPLEGAIEKGFAAYETGGEIYAGVLLDEIGQQYTSYPEWLTVAAGRAGKQYSYPAYLEKVEAHLAANPIDGNTSSTDLHRFALAVAAAGEDPANFMVGGSAVNLVEKGIENLEAASPAYNNAMVWALITLDSGNYSYGTTLSRDNLKAAILAAQNANGSFKNYDNTGESTDLTAMTLVALAPYYSEGAVKTAVDDAIDYLAGVQLADGSFKDSDVLGGQWGDYYGSSNSSTTAQVLLALSALGIDCRTDARFIKNGSTVVDALLRCQRADGMFFWNDADTDNLFGGEQVLAALVAYQRFSKNKANYFDFGAADSGSMTLSVQVDGESKAIPFVKSQLNYELTLFDEVSELTFMAIPKSPYETVETALNSAITFVDHKVEFKIKGRTGVTTYTITKVPPAADVVLDNEIQQLPPVIGEADLATVQKLLADYEALPMEQRALVSGYPALQLKYLTYIQGKDLSYQTSGTTPEGHRYSWTLKGSEITELKAFDTGIALHSPNAAAIQALAPDAFIVHFRHNGTLPGNATVALETRLEDGLFELFFFNGGQGEKKMDVSGANGEIKFDIKHCSDYYLVRLPAAVSLKSESSRTGDRTNVLPWSVLMGVAAVTAVITFLIRRRAKKS